MASPAMPGHAGPGLAQPRPRHVERGLRQIEHGQVAKPFREQMIDQKRSAAADVDESGVAIRAREAQQVERRRGRSSCGPLHLGFGLGHIDALPMAAAVEMWSPFASAPNMNAGAGTFNGDATPPPPDPAPPPARRRKMTRLRRAFREVLTSVPVTPCFMFEHARPD